MKLQCSSINTEVVVYITRNNQKRRALSGILVEYLIYILIEHLLLCIIFLSLLVAKKVS